MNIDSPSILSLFSSAEGLDKLQQTIQSDAGGTQAFSTALLEKIDQLKAINGENLLVEELSGENFLEKSVKHEIAGSLNGKEELADLSELIGNNLPINDQLTKGIDLEKTLETLSAVMNTFEDGLSEDLNLITQLNQIADDVQNLKEIFINDETSEFIHVENQLELLTVEIETLKESFSQENFVSQQAAIPVRINGGNPSRKISGEAIVKEQPFLPMNTIADESIETKIEQNFVEQKFGINKLGEGQEPIIEQSEKGLVETPAKTAITDLEAFFQQAKVSQKPTDIEISDVLDEFVSDKGIPKIVSSMTMMNRVLLSENQTEIPVMTKHFVQPGWDQELSEKVLWMHKKAIPSAELKLNPKHLGPISIKVDVTQDQATVSFIAEHAIVKEAIEAAIPRLKEMFSAQHINLLDANVSQQESGDKQPRDFNQTSNNQANENEQDIQEQNETENKQDVTELVGEIETARAVASNGILSIFA